MVSLLDIIGPVMVGPSSSHTAGACRLGLLARGLVGGTPHRARIELLLSVLHRLRDHGNTVVVIEHNLDVIKTADWIIDLGPEGGLRGGTIVAAGTPEQVAANEASHTGRFLAPILQGRGHLPLMTRRQRARPAELAVEDVALEAGV